MVARRGSGLMPNDLMPIEMPRVLVCAGGGGVGKTTTSAALAVALARRGHSTLIVTIDPARRLAGAMGVAIGDAIGEVPLPGTHGRLFALMPDPRRAMRTFLDQLFEGQDDAKARVLVNRVYRGLSDAAAGVHELVAMNLVARAAMDRHFDVLVIDTAPSRYAIDFVTYPGRLVTLLGGRTVTWLANMAQNVAPKAAARPRRGLLEWGKGRAESLLARITGPTLIGDTASLFGDLSIVRARFVTLAQRAADLLLGERASYVLVAAPTAAAQADVHFLARRLDKLGRAPRVVVLNRADQGAAPWAREIAQAPGVSPSILEAVRLLEEERASRTAAANAVSADIAKRLPAVRVVRLPLVEDPAPEAIIAALSRELERDLDVFWERERLAR